MFKKLFCKHQYKEVSRYYKLFKKLETFSMYASWNLKAFKKFQCSLCNKTYVDNVFDKEYLLREELSWRIGQLKGLDYKDYEDLLLE